MIKRLIALATASSLSTPVFGGTYEAICSYYSAYQPCRITIGVDNVRKPSTDYLYVDRITEGFKGLRGLW